MKKGDPIRIKKTDMTGKITEKLPDNKYRVFLFDVGTTIILYENELEPFKTEPAAPVTPIPCIICGHAYQVTNTDETEFAVYCGCGVGQTGETKDEAAANWNQLHANIGRGAFDE